MEIYTPKLTEIPALPFSAGELFKKNEPILLFLLLLVIWCLAPKWIRHIDGTAGYVDQSNWLLILLSLIAFMLAAALVWWLLQRSWTMLKLPSIHLMISQFSTLEIWQQLAFYFASFASLLLAACICLMAIC